MHRSTIEPTGRPRPFGDDEIIVSKTDLRGHLTYVNDVFVRVSGFEEADLLGRPHNVIRHPAMPRAVFWLLWSEIQAGREIFAHVLNLAANGDHYWVFAHVTPTVGASGNTVGYHSNRRTASPRAIDAATALYAELVAAEARGNGPVDALERSKALLVERLESRGLDHQRWVWSLESDAELEAELGSLSELEAAGVAG